MYSEHLKNNIEKKTFLLSKMAVRGKIDSGCISTSGGSRFQESLFIINNFANSDRPMKVCSHFK